jgi:hypothetical protein
MVGSAGRSWIRKRRFGDLEPDQYGSEDLYSVNAAKLGLAWQ